MAIIVFILIVTAVAFVKMIKSNSGSNPATATKTEQTGKNNSVASSTAKNTASADADAKAIESELNSINDNEFSADQLSDQNIGL